MTLYIAGINIDRLTEKVDKIGVDIDNYGHKRFVEDVKATEEIAERFGIVDGFASKKGWHIEVRLSSPVTLLRAFQIRYFLKDDYHRLCRDMLKTMNGARVIDVLFDRKVVKRERITD